MERAYRNLGYVLLVLIPIFIAGFWIPYFSEFPNFDASITIAVHVHAILLFCFLGLLIVQPLAIRLNAFSTHRLLGKLSYYLMPLILISSVMMMWKEYRENLADGATFAAARNAEFLSAAQLVLLAGLYILAIVRIRHRDVAAHLRYIICISLVLLPAGLARVLGYWFHVRQSASQTVCLALIDIVLIGLIAFDMRRKSNMQPYVVALLAYIVIEAVWVFLGRPV